MVVQDRRTAPGVRALEGPPTRGSHPPFTGSRPAPSLNPKGWT